MKKLLAILVLGLMWSNVGFAEKIKLDCKYSDSLRQVMTSGATLTSSEIKKAPKQITISLDMKNKKIIHIYPLIFGVQTKWEEDKIIWYKQEKLENGKLMRAYGVLDRYTGRYDYEKKFLKDALEVTESVLITWKCKTKKKKF